MNYLSHFYFDQSNTDSYYLLGIALPDLSKNFHRRWNIHPHKNHIKWQHSANLLSIEKGWNRHLAVDFLFHESDYFKSKTDYIKEKISTVPFENQKVRPYMLAHIGLELILDTLLVQDRLVSIPSFYKNLQNIDNQELISFLSLNGIMEAADFIPFYERFNTVQYLNNYQGNESIVYALNRINQKLTGTLFDDQSFEALKVLMIEIMKEIAQDYISIFDHIQKNIK